MKRDTKPSEVALSGESVQNPDRPLIKVTDELEEAQLDRVAGGLSLAVGGVGSFHPGAWST